jgi:hypothetical protein
MWLKHLPNFAGRYHAIAYSIRTRQVRMVCRMGPLMCTERTLLPSCATLKVGDTKNGIPLFVDGIGGPGAYDRRSRLTKA